MRRGGQISGIVSLVTIFCALCLCVFAVLTLGAADRERTLSALACTRQTQYYDADTQAVRELSSLAPTLSEGERVRLSFPIGDTQTLLVEAERRGESYKILRWQSVYTGSWETNDRIDVWSGK